MNRDIGSIVGDIILFGLFALYLWWIIIENKRDWINRPKRLTRHISLCMTAAGIIAVLLHIIGFEVLHINFFWWSMPLLALGCSFILGVTKPEASVATAYRFMTLAGPASVLGSAMGFIPLLAGQIGGCLLGFRLGERVHHLCSRQRKA